MPRMVRLSLKYRIAIVIFVLESIMMAFVIGPMLSVSHESARKQMAGNEKVVLDLLSDLSRIALFTAEYDELQPYMEQVVADPHVEHIMLVNNENRIVVSTNLADVGQPLFELRDDATRFWKTKTIENAAGSLGLLAINFSHLELIEANREARRLGITIALIGMSVIAIVGIATGFLMTRRLKKLTQASTRLAEGDLTAKTGLRGRDEIALVGRAFDQMVESIGKYVQDLQAREAELRQAHDDLERRVRERTAELAVARDQALEASRTKSAFLANMSHELRTPLNAIIGYSELLYEEAHDKGLDDNLPDLDRIKSAGNHLLHLINDILDLSKIEAGKMELHLETFRICDVLDEAKATMEPLAAKNNNRLTIECEEPLCTMYADVTKVRQAVFNLLSNACKFTENGEVNLKVSVEAVSDEPFVSFRVSDSGIGIEPAQLKKLFDEFSQADPSTTRKYGGTGLGLTISRRFCVMMGGDIQVTSEVGKGSTFTMLLPLVVKLRDQKESGNSLARGRPL